MARAGWGVFSSGPSELWGVGLSAALKSPCDEVQCYKKPEAYQNLLLLQTELMCGALSETT